MLTKLRKQTKGFTIIEVLIVLAIAALILLIVFLAVPALQRNNRNTQVRNDASVLLGFLNDYAANNNGSLPNSANGVCYDSATGNVGMVSSGACSTTANKVGSLRGGLTVNASSSTQAQPTAPNTLTLNVGAKCNGTSLGGSASPRAAAVGFVTETAGGVSNQCSES